VIVDVNIWTTYLVATMELSYKHKNKKQMETIKANLEGTPIETVVDMDSLYMVDFSKCTNVNDLMIILSSIGFTFSPHHPGFQTLKPFLALDRPIPARPQQPEAKEIKLPKLKPVNNKAE
jgi:hypothetical protein